MISTRWVFGFGFLVFTSTAAHADAPPPPPTPSVVIQNPTSKAEGFDNKAALATIDAKNAKLLACYQKSGQKTERAHATLVVRADGKVTSVKLAKVATDFEPCVHNVLFALVFAKSKVASTTIDVDIDFENGVDPLMVGDGWGTIGTGRYGTIGGGGTGGACGGGGGGGGGGVRRTTAVPTVSIGQPEVKGNLDKAIIRRYIKRNINKIQYCYEKTLLADTTGKLAGSVVARFKIQASGSVDAASIKTEGAGGMKDVGTCVGNVIKDIEFPKPKDGGVDVKYPFDFRQAGN